MSSQKFSQNEGRLVDASCWRCTPPRLERRFLADAHGLVAAEGDSQPTTKTVKKKPQRRFDMKKSINMWAFPYPQQWTLKESLQLAKDAGFDGVEINFAARVESFPPNRPMPNSLPLAKWPKRLGIAISGVCSFLYWPYAFSHNDEARRNKGVELARKMIHAAKLVGTENLLVVPGAVWAPWMPEYEPVPNDVCDRRAKDAVRKILPEAEKAGVYINIENIFANGYLFSPQEMIDFVDGFQSEACADPLRHGKYHALPIPEHWVPLLGKRIKNIHFKEWDKRMQEFNLHTFRTLLDGTTNWPAVIEALDKIDYRGYLTFEYFHPFSHYPEVLVYQTSDALDWMLGRKTWI